MSEAVRRALEGALASVSGPFFFVGSGKNAGKTTAMNAVNRMLATRDTAVGVTTIGHDGEGRDAILGTEKPPVEVFAGNLVCLTRRMLDDAGDALEPVAPTGFVTPIGALEIARARRAANVEILGPETNARCAEVCDRMRRLGARIGLVDGAFSRRTQMAMRDEAPLALIVSGDLGTTTGEVTAAIRYWVELLSLPRAAEPDDDAAGIETPGGVPGASIVFTDGWVRVRGPLLGEAAADLARIARGRRVLLNDATKVFCEEREWRALRGACASIGVVRSFDLRFVASNPTARFKGAFDAFEFAHALKSAASEKPVIDVVSGIVL
ncbi:MAG: hypothetical protein IT350_12820 [Deltaproteobacteria bacterium]|nr:hypothetical protein [Deltaproteobacteria bacterium]